MKIYIKKVKDSKGTIKESLWIRFVHQGKLYRKPLGLDNTRANMRLAKNEIMPTMQLKLLMVSYLKSKFQRLMKLLIYHLVFKVEIGQKLFSMIIF